MPNRTCLTLAGLNVVGMLVGALVSAGPARGDSPESPTEPALVPNADPAPLIAAEQRAFQSAVLVAAPSIVTIETIGGFDKLGDVRLNTGATTGTVVGRDGWIISSAFNLAGQPDAIFVTLDDGRRVTAKRVAIDRVRKLVLLQANATDLEPIAMAPANTVSVGRWAIAAGRTYGQSPNVSVGIVSALGRIGGLAMQTDAKVSPVNYGGPLLDVAGAAIGILVPMSPKTTAGGDALAGIEWYDSGIGFAVPIADVLASARKLQTGEDLLPGKLGVSFTGTGLLDEAAEIRSLHPLGPADTAGIKPGDVVSKINGEAVSGLRELKLRLAGLYAGEQIRLLVRSGESEREVSLKLVADLPPFQFSWLGLVVDRGAGGGVVVRTVDDAGPSAGALKAGDVVLAIDDAEVSSVGNAQQRMQRRRVNEPVRITIERDGQTSQLNVVPAALPSSLPDDLTPPLLADVTANDDFVGRQTGTAFEGQVNYSIYVPIAASGGRAAGLLVWLADGGNAIQTELQRHCESRNIALLVPSPVGDDWAAGDVAAIESTIQEATKKLTVDRRRVAVFASGSAAQLGLSLAQQENPAASGLILDDPKLTTPPGNISPDNRLLWGVIGEEGTKAEAILRFLTAQQHPVTLLPDPFEDGAALVRWVDWMGRL